MLTRIPKWLPGPAIAGLLAVPLPAIADHNEHSYGPDQGHYNTTRVRGNCVDYEVHARGGKAAIRFMHNTANYRVIDHGVYRGRICNQRNLTAELGRIDPYTQVILKVNGARYSFDRGERAHDYINYWYRKYVRISLPHYAPQHGGHDKAYRNTYKPAHKKAHKKAHKYKGHDKYAYRNSGHDQKHYYPVKPRNGYGHQKHHRQQYYGQGHDRGYHGYCRHN